MKKRFPRAYYKMLRKNKKIIVRLAKASASSPYEYQYGLDMLMQHVKLMYEYYQLGINVISSDEIPNLPMNRMESMKKLIDLYESKVELFDYNEEEWESFITILKKYIRYWWD